VIAAPQGMIVAECYLNRNSATQKAAVMVAATGFIFAGLGSYVALSTVLDMTTIRKGYQILSALYEDHDVAHQDLVRSRNSPSAKINFENAKVQLKEGISVSMLSESTTLFSASCMLFGVLCFPTGLIMVVSDHQDRGIWIGILVITGVVITFFLFQKFGAEKLTLKIVQKNEKRNRNRQSGIDEIAVISASGSGVMNRGGSMV
jgi:uncharacterized membrane protein YiaA